MKLKDKSIREQVVISVRAWDTDGIASGKVRSMLLGVEEVSSPTAERIFSVVYSTADTVKSFLSHSTFSNILSDSSFRQIETASQTYKNGCKSCNKV